MSPRGDARGGGDGRTRPVAGTGGHENARHGGSAPAAVRLEDLLGRRVLAGNHRSIGRIEEFRAERSGRTCVLTEVVLGPGGLLERLGVGVRLLFGRHGGGRVARWDQIDWSDPKRPRLACAVSELRDL